MIKKLFLALAVVLMTTTAVAQTTLGQSCENPIPVDKSYEGHVDVDPEVGYKEVWYTAWSYDLPMHVYFSPDSMNSKWGPEVEIDFSCTSGDYTFDHKLDSVIKILKVMNVTLPVGFLCDKVVRNGKVEWDLSIDEKYRDYLTEYGLTHNVQAFVKVIYSESGSIRLTPDTAFQSCIEHGHYAMLGDTIDIAANDSSKMIVLPYSEWKNDSIRFVWIGDKPARVWVAEDECRFTPVDASVYVKAKYDIDNATPKKLYTADMQSAIDNWIGAGIFYAKVLSEGSGQLVIERIPLGETQGGAVLLQRGKPVQLKANDNRVFCFPKGWEGTEFVAPTEYLMSMFVSNTSEFEASYDDENVLAVYAFSKVDGKRKLQLSTGDITSLGASSADDYVYVKFQCNTATTLTPTLWNTSSCINNTILVTSGETFTVPANSKSVYRMVYDDWKNYDFTMKWTGKTSLSSKFASYCSFTTTATDLLSSVAIKSGKSAKVASTVVDNWMSRLEDDGFVYFRLTSSRVGDMTMTSSRPEEEDPASPCVAASTELKSGDQITLNLNSAFTIYRINYAEWVAQDIKLAWAGESPLHTFVAETCQFAVAPYNRYVVNYVVVPSNGEYVLDVATLTQYADKVDADGYLYIRFLTEKEGTLSVTSY